MTAQEKAQHIFLSMQEHVIDRYCIKKVSMIAVDEINKVLEKLQPRVQENLWLYRELTAITEYYQAVQQELEQMK